MKNIFDRCYNLTMTKEKDNKFVYRLYVFPQR